MDNSGLKDMRPKKVIKRKIGFILAKIGKIFTKSKKIEKILYKILREKDYYNSSPTLKKTMSNVLNDSIKNDLEKITIPTLTIWGQKDDHTPLYFTQIIRLKVKNLIVKIIPDAFHNPYFTHPKKCAKIIKNWLEK
jgi:pimeloyl-ACP methyl ester carboxylesterase